MKRTSSQRAKLFRKLAQNNDWDDETEYKHQKWFYETQLDEEYPEELKPKSLQDKEFDEEYSAWMDAKTDESMDYKTDEKSELEKFTVSLDNLNHYDHDDAVILIVEGDGSLAWAKKHLEEYEWSKDRYGRTAALEFNKPDLVEDLKSEGLKLNLSRYVKPIESEQSFED